MGKKATAAQTEQRITEVMRMLAMGTSRPDVLQYAAKNWSLATRSTDTLMKKARARFAEMAAPDREEMRGLALTRYTWALFTSAKALDIQRFIAAQTRIDTLFALPTAPTLRIVAELLTPQEAALLADLLNILEQHGTSAGDVFSAMMAQIAEAQAEQTAQADNAEVKTDGR